MPITLGEYFQTWGNIINELEKAIINREISIDIDDKNVRIDLYDSRRIIARILGPQHDRATELIIWPESQGPKTFMNIKLRQLYHLAIRYSKNIPINTTLRNIINEFKDLNIDVR